MKIYIVDYKDDEGNLVDQVTLQALDEQTAHKIVANGLELKQITIVGSLISSYDIREK
jgi:hypothetical protein